VVRKDGALLGVEAVIDKDRASALLASRLGMDLFVISTDTEYVYLNFKKADQQPLLRVTAAELQAYSEAGHFPPGNMGPKVEAALRFLNNGGRECVITSCENLGKAISGSVGTHIVTNRVEPETEHEHEVEVPVGGLTI